MKVEPLEGELWPRERDGHAACCLGYDGDHPHLLIHGGRGKDNKTLNDMWLFNLSSRKWQEVTIYIYIYIYIYIQVVLCGAA